MNIKQININKMKELNIFKRFLAEEQINKKIATNEKDIEVIADIDAFSSRKYLLDRGKKEEIMVKYKDRMEKLSPNTPEEKYELLVNTVEYYSSDEAKKEFERITNEYYNHPLVYYKDIYQRSSNYYSGY